MRNTSLKLAQQIADDLEKVFLLHYQKPADRLTMQRLSRYHWVISDIKTLFERSEHTLKGLFLRRFILAVFIGATVTLFFLQLPGNPFSTTNGFGIGVFNTYLLIWGISALCLALLYAEILMPWTISLGTIGVITMFSIAHPHNAWITLLSFSPVLYILGLYMWAKVMAVL